MDTSVRVCTPADWRALKTVRLAALADAPTAFGVSHASAASYLDCDWQRRADSSDQRAFVLALNGEISGEINGEINGEMPVGLAAHAASSDGQCHLLAMWVAPAFRGGDVAARLVALVKQRARAGGHAQIVLDVAPENVRAARFYQKQGFAFLPHWEPLESHPHILVQKMACPL